MDSRRRSDTPGQGRMIRPVVALLILVSASSVSAEAPGRLSNIQEASRLLDYSNTTVTVREDYTHTTWPVARRTLILTGANGRRVSMAIADGGALSLSALSLYRASYASPDEYVLLGARECVSFDPVDLTIRRCAVRPPCNGVRRVGLTYIGRYDWANGFDPPHGRFGYGWRFLSFEQGYEAAFCPE